MHFGATFFLLSYSACTRLLSVSLCSTPSLSSSLSGLRRFKSPSGSAPPVRFRRPSNQDSLRRAAPHANANPTPQQHARRLLLLVTTGELSSSSRTSGDASFVLRFDSVKCSLWN